MLAKNLIHGSAAMFFCAFAAIPSVHAFPDTIFFNSGAAIPVVAHLTLQGSVHGIPGTATFDQVSRGRWQNNGTYGFPSTINYLAGQQTAALEFHNFFVFDLGVVPDGALVSNATLEIWNPINGYNSIRPSLTYVLWDIITALDQVTTPNLSPANVPIAPPRLDIFNDLGSGTSFGARSVSDSDENSWVQITLNSAAVDYLNRQIRSGGGKVGFGGSVAAISEPETCGMLLAGLSLLGLVARRKKLEVV